MRLRGNIFRQTPVRNPLRIRALAVGILLVVSGLLLFLVEGGSSFVIFLNDVVRYDRGPTLNLVTHLQHDPDLGWISIPNFRSQDFYGPGIGLQIDDRGSRCTSAECQPELVAERRIICSGDSFTFGTGVGNEETWCSLLAADLPQVESINMAQPGYGVDQAYLWYMRDGLSLEHELLLFAFIDEDFRRILTPEFNGTAKPVLRVEAGDLVVSNVPVPEIPGRQGLRGRMTRAMNQLRMVELSRKIGLGRVDRQDQGKRIQLLSGHLFSDLTSATAESGRHLVFVYLPSRFDFSLRDLRLVNRNMAKAVADSVGAPFIDLVPDLRQLPQAEIESFFIKPGEVTDPSSANHYSRAGNRWIAQQLLQRLREIPSVDSVLESSASSRGEPRRGESPLLPSLPGEDQNS